MSDPRLLVIPKRLAGIKKIYVIMSSKGGVGKTIISTLLALASSSMGYKTGLLDLDFTNPSTHIVLGTNPWELEIVEEKGIIPPLVHGIKYMSITIFTRENPTPMRGEAVVNAFRELLAITQWGELDALFIDTPPGISDEHLELLTYLGNQLEVIVVATPSPLAIKSVERLVKVLLEGKYRIAGLIENMSDKPKLHKLAEELRIDYLGNIPYVKDLDERIGNVELLKETPIWKKVLKIAYMLLCNN
ncbi:MAG: P-loop NTPase [Staphylothermus sp.]|nr:P-loop NTPase [Staphylothermus sp.]